MILHWSNRDETLEEYNLCHPKNREEAKTKKSSKIKFSPIAESIEEILMKLMKQKKISELRPPMDTGTWNYNPSQQCAYHLGGPGHSIEQC